MVIKMGVTRISFYWSYTKVKGFFQLLLLFFVLLVLYNPIISISSYSTAINTQSSDGWQSISCNYCTRDTEFTDVAFLNDTHGWIIGENGTGFFGGIILFTVDSGESWELQYYNATQWFKDIEIINDSTLWVTGMGGLFYTTNSGKSWQFHAIGMASALSYVEFINSTHGWTATANTLYSTTNGGLNWQNTSSWTFNDTPLEIEFVTPDIGYIVGFLGVYKTIDTGSSWIQQLYGSLCSISMINVTEGWVVGGNGLYHMTDGATWESLRIPYYPSLQKRPNPYFRDILFVNHFYGWIVGNKPSMMYTTNGGRDWYAQEVPEEAYEGLSALAFLNITHGWAVGYRGAIIHTSDGGGLGTKLVVLMDPIIILFVLLGIGFFSIVIFLLIIRKFVHSQT